MQPFSTFFVGLFAPLNSCVALLDMYVRLGHFCSAVQGSLRTTYTTHYTVVGTRGGGRWGVVLDGGDCGS